MRINELIKGLRVRDNLTQVDLADKLNCNRQKIADWERGKSTPSVEDIVALTEIFNVSADYLLGLAEPATQDRDLRFVCEYTGLSEKAVERLIETRQYFKKSFVQDVSKNLSVIMDYVLESGYIRSLALDIEDYSNTIKEAISKINRIEQRVKEPQSFQIGKTFEFFELIDVKKDLYFRLFNAQENVKDIIRNYSNEEYSELLDADIHLDEVLDEAYDKQIEGSDNNGNDQETE